MDKQALSDIELKKRKSEFLKVSAAKMDMEVTILEREADIERLKKNIEIQDKREKELKDILGI